MVFKRRTAITSRWGQWHKPLLSGEPGPSAPRSPWESGNQSLHPQAVEATHTARSARALLPSALRATSRRQRAHPVATRPDENVLLLQPNLGGGAPAAPPRYRPARDWRRSGRGLWLERRHLDEPNSATASPNPATTRHRIETIASFFPVHHQSGQRQHPSAIW